jgi:hypothetical protein
MYPKQFFKTLWFFGRKVKEDPAITGAAARFRIFYVGKLTINSFAPGKL